MVWWGGRKTSKGESHLLLQLYHLAPHLITPLILEGAHRLTPFGNSGNPLAFSRSHAAMTRKS